MYFSADNYKMRCLEEHQSNGSLLLLEMSPKSGGLIVLRITLTTSPKLVSSGSCCQMWGTFKMHLYHIMSNKPLLQSTNSCNLFLSLWNGRKMRMRQVPDSNAVGLQIGHEIELHILHKEITKIALRQVKMIDKIMEMTNNERRKTYWPI